MLVSIPPKLSVSSRGNRSISLRSLKKWKDYSIPMKALTLPMFEGKMLLIEYIVAAVAGGHNILMIGSPGLWEIHDCETNLNHYAGT